MSEFRRCPFWEQELAKKYSYKTVSLHVSGRLTFTPWLPGGSKWLLSLPVIIVVPVGVMFAFSQTRENQHSLLGLMVVRKFRASLHVLEKGSTWDHVVIF